MFLEGSVVCGVALGYRTSEAVGVGQGSCPGVPLPPSQATPPPPCALQSVPLLQVVICVTGARAPGGPRDPCWGGTGAMSTSLEQRQDSKLRR